MKLRPLFNPGVYVYVEADSVKSPYIGMFKEHEGTTFIMQKDDAVAEGLDWQFESAWISLTTHTALDGLGVTAAFSSALSAAGISCNVIAAVFHDHIFVPVERAEEAMDILAELSLP